MIVCRQSWKLPGSVVVAAATAISLAAATAPDLNKVLEGVAANIVMAQGIAAVETVEHARYEKRKNNATCAEMAAAGFEASRGPLTWHDRLRRDVLTTGGFQTYALTKSGSLEKGNVGGLLTTEGSGEFGTFLRNIIASDGGQYQSRGVHETPAGLQAEFAFTVLSAKSHYEYAAATVPYSGSLFVDPDFGGLKRLTLLTENQGDACRLEYNIDYTSTKAGGRQIVVPQTSVMDLLYTDGREFHSETHYSDYYWPQMSLDRNDNSGPNPLPPGLHLKVRLEGAIDDATAAAGDPVVAVVRADVKDKNSGAILIHAGDRLHGRLTTFEEYILNYWKVGAVEDAPEPQWNVAMVFETIESGTGSQTLEPISLTPLDDGDRSPHDAPLTPSSLQQLRPAGGGYFRFFKKTLMLDQKFESEWETHE